MTTVRRETQVRGTLARDKGAIRGRARQGVRSDMSPPVVRRRRVLHEPTMCERCGAVYSHKTWRTGEFAVQADPVGSFWTVCPACEQLATGEFFGRVLIRGAFATAHEPDLRDRIRGVVARARYTQPMRRVVSIERLEDQLEVLTTSQKLAHRIASQLKRSFGGAVTYAWSDRDGELYATWQREDVPPPPAPPRRRRIKGHATTKPSLDVEIQARGITLDPAWRDLIETSAAKLAERYPEPLRIHVTLTHSRHHRHGVEEVSVVANLPGKTVRVSKHEAGVTDAIRAAFRVLAVECGRFHRERRRYLKMPGPRPQGSIRRIFRDAGYGFIRLDRGDDVYFHRHALHELDFGTLRPGLPVEVEVELGEEGPQASRVFPVGERGRA